MSRGFVHVSKEMFSLSFSNNIQYFSGLWGAKSHSFKIYDEQSMFTQSSYLKQSCNYRRKQK